MVQQLRVLADLLEEPGPSTHVSPLQQLGTLALGDLHLFGLHRNLHMYGIYFYRHMLWDNGIVL